jgi:hypothetical protein
MVLVALRERRKGTEDRDCSVSAQAMCAHTHPPPLFPAFFHPHPAAGFYLEIKKAMTCDQDQAIEILRKR